MPPEVRLRPFTAEDAVRADAEAAVPGAIDFFEWHPSTSRSQRFAADGLLGADHGNLVVEVEGVGVVGEVGWVPVHHGRPRTGRR